MDERAPGRFESLLMRAFDGEADAAERDELAASADAEPRLAELAELRAALIEALAVPGPVDVAADVLAALDEASWAPVGDSLRAALAGPVSLADAVMADLPGADLSAFFDGELPDARAVAQRLEHDAAARATLAAWAAAGHDVRAAVSGPVDVWPGVAKGIGVEPDAVRGWESVAEQVRSAFEEIEKVDVSGAVMAAIEPRVRALPRWASLWVPLAGFAAAAAMILAVALTADPQDALVASFRLAPVNDAQVEDISGGDDVVVQVMQFEDNGPTFIMVDAVADHVGEASL